MPIRIQCSCGKALAVKDELAGKNIRCPNCQTALRVPPSGTSAGSPRQKAAPQKPAPQKAKQANPTKQAAPAKQAPARTAPARPAASPAATGAGPGGHGDLFDEEGFESVSGPICPACRQPLRPGAVLCTHCGLNLQTGERMAGYGTVTEETLGHHQLDAAVKRMQDDDELQRRTTNTGMPWWFLLIMLIFLGCFAFGAVTIVNAAVGGSEATGLAATIKEAAADKNIVWGCVIGGLVLMGFARLWLTVVGFMESAGAGLTTLFLWHKFLGQLSDHPVIGLIYTLGLFTMLSGAGLAAANYFGAS